MTNLDQAFAMSVQMMHEQALDVPDPALYTPRGPLPDPEEEPEAGS